MVIVWYFFILPTFAQWTETSASWLSTVQEKLNQILALCSRWWVILAVLAGKLMTNDLVYASIIHMDVYLWKIWNIMKNFANFALLGIVLFNIVKNLTGKDKMNIKDIITKTLVAGILIQASRFMVGALVDISTIAVSAVGAFPSTFLNNNVDLQNFIKNQIKTTPTKYLLDMQWKEVMTATNTSPASSENRNEILPTYDSVSGPLIYLGFSVFKFQNYMNVGQTAGAEQLTISFSLRLVVILMYTLWLALLFLANIIRVAFLWIFIIASPIIVLSMLFFKDKWLEWWSSWWIGKYLSFKVMIDLIFKPVIFVAGFSMILIFVVSIQKVMQTAMPKEINGVTISITSWSSTLAVSDITTIKVKEGSVRGKDPFDTQGIGTTVKETWQTIFANLIIFFLTMFLMREFIKIAATSWTWPVADVMKKVTKNVEEFAKTLPILPLAWWSSFTAAKTFMSKNKEKILQGAGMNVKGEFGQYDEGKFKTYEESFKEQIGGKVYWTDADWKSLEKLSGSRETHQSFIDTSRDLSTKRSGWLSVSNQRRFAALQNILMTDNGLWFTWKLDDRTEDKIAKFFNRSNGKNPSSPTNAWRLYDLLWWSANVKSSWQKTAPKTYDELKKMTFWVPAKE